MVRIVDEDGRVAAGRLQRLPASQRALLKAIAQSEDGVEHPGSHQFVSSLRLPASIANHARAALEQHDLIHRRGDGRWTLVDPVLSSYLRRSWSEHTICMGIITLIRLCSEPRWQRTPAPKTAKAAYPNEGNLSDGEWSQRDSNQHPALSNEETCATELHHGPAHHHSEIQWTAGDTAAWGAVPGVCVTPQGPPSTP